MKNIQTLLLIFILLFLQEGFSQNISFTKDNYQVFKENGFMIKCEGKLTFDRIRKQWYGFENSTPYHVYHNGIDYNINVSHFERLLSGFSNSKIEEYNKENIDYFKMKLDEMSIKNRLGKFKNIDAVYYENILDGRTTYAVFFHYKMKSYTLQVTRDKGVRKLFEDFINSFKLIEN